jgi:hypothetical protein
VSRRPAKAAARRVAIGRRRHLIATLTLAIAATPVTATPAVRAAPAPAHSFKVWRIERLDSKPHRLKVRIPVGEAKPGSFWGDVNIKRLNGRYVPYRAVANAAGLGYGYLFEGGKQSLVPAGDVDEGPAHATSPSCAELGLESCDMPNLGLSSTSAPGAVGWYTDTPTAVDFYAILYDVKAVGAPTFDKAYPGWRAVPVSNVSVNVVTKQQADATGATDGYYTVEHFHRAAVSSGRGYSVVQAILPCFGTSGPGVGSARLTNTAGLSVLMDCDHPLYVAVASRRTDWTLTGDVVGVNQQAFPYSRLIEVNIPG